MTQWGVDTLFNPAKRHMDEEKRRLQATRAEVGDNSGGKRIDLESGKVRISRGTPKDQAEASETGERDEASETAEQSAQADLDEPAAPADARADAASAEAVDAGVDVARAEDADSA